MAVDYEAAALDAARGWCGWVVTPPETVTVTLDGPGGRVLSLPSRHVTELISVTEDGVELDLADLMVSMHGMVRKRSGACWTSGYGAIVVEMTHGYPAAEDFEAAVAQAATSMAEAGTRTDTALKRKKIDDVEYEWFDVASSYLPTALLNRYRILPSP